MPFKDPQVKKAKQREYARKHYLANTEKVKNKAREQNIVALKRNRDFVISLKESNPCVDCEQYYPFYVMHFDHIFEKGGSIANLMRSAVSLKRLQREIENCELVCANCHALRTHERKQGDEDISDWLDY